MMAFAVGKSIIQAETGLNFQNEDHAGLKYNANKFCILMKRKQKNDLKS